MQAKFIFLFISMGRISLTRASSIPASWLAAWWAEEADAELGLGWALQQQGLAVLHDVSTHLGTEDNTFVVSDNRALMNIHDCGYKTPHWMIPFNNPQGYVNGMLHKFWTRNTPLHLHGAFCHTCCMATSISSRLSAESPGAAISACFSSLSRSLPTRRPSSDRQRRWKRMDESATEHYTHSEGCALAWMLRTATKRNICCMY